MASFRRRHDHNRSTTQEDEPEPIKPEPKKSRKRKKREDQPPPRRKFRVKALEAERPSSTSNARVDVTTAGLRVGADRPRDIPNAPAAPEQYKNIDYTQTRFHTVQTTINESV